MSILGDELPPEVGQAISQRKVVVTPSSILSGNGHKPALTAGEKKTTTENIPTSTHEGPREEQTSTEEIASLVVPLMVRDEVIGVLGLQETDEARFWSAEEIALVEAISRQVSQAAEQLRLFDETQERAARERRVHEISEKIQAAQSLEEALQIAVKEVGLSLKAPQTRVQLGVE
jgi:GAF domain-containing protein